MERSGVSCVRALERGISMKLYPRLLSRFARQLFEEQVNASLDELESRAAAEHPLMTWPAVGAARVTPDELLETRRALMAVARRYGYPVSPRVPSLGSLDREFAFALMRGTELTPAEADFGEVWSFLALVLVPDLTWWRARG